MALGGFGPEEAGGEAMRGDSTRCEVPRCRRPYDMTYYGKRLCFACWERFAEWEDDGTALRQALKVAATARSHN